MGDAARKGLAKWEVAALAVAGGAGGLALINRLVEAGAGEPRSVLDGEYGTYAWTLGDIFYTVKGQGEPIVLIHGVYAGASSYEFRRVFDLLAREFRVYAFDLLGFGLSARPPILYTPVLYEELIEDFILQVVGGADQPVRVIALFAGRGVHHSRGGGAPGIFARLVLIEPTGFEERRPAWRTPRAGGSCGGPALAADRTGGLQRHRLTRQHPVFPRLPHLCAIPRPSATTWSDYYYTTAHQPGARLRPRQLHLRHTQHAGRQCLSAASNVRYCSAGARTRNSRPCRTRAPSVRRTRARSYESSIAARSRRMRPPMSSSTRSAPGSRPLAPVSSEGSDSVFGVGILCARVDTAPSRGRPMNLRLVGPRP